MNWFNFASWHLMMTTVVVGAHSYDNMAIDPFSNELRHKRSSGPENLILKLKISGESKVIHLKPTRQLLANENLPVWFPTNCHGERYKKLHNIMKNEVGDFTMYHDYNTRSAVVYFHKRGELDGIVDTEYKIEALPFNELHREHVIESGFYSLLNVGKFFRSLIWPNRPVVSDEMCHDPELKVYPELLIAISHDMFQSIEKESSLRRGVKTISHVLTVYNVVDMLYRYVKSAAIFLNIAGIVIEGTENEWGFLSEFSHFTYVDAEKINERVSEYFRKTDKYIPRHSYDYVIYNTRLSIQKLETAPILGIAINAGFTPMFFPHKYLWRYNAAVRDYESYEHYVTIAHELAHIFGVNHDKLVNWFFFPSCERSIMATLGCPHFCTKWSDQSEKELKKFLNSPAHCVLRNKPRSLFPPGPRPMFTLLEQCQCYGYESYHDTADDTFENGCDLDVICISENGELEGNLPVPLDGTYCDRDLEKVCWAEKCVRITHETIK